MTGRTNSLPNVEHVPMTRADACMKRIPAASDSNTEGRRMRRRAQYLNMSPVDNCSSDPTQMMVASQLLWARWVSQRAAQSACAAEVLDSSGPWPWYHLNSAINSSIAATPTLKLTNQRA